VDERSFRDQLAISISLAVTRDLLRRILSDYAG
jgi:hypothetical protein